MRFAVLGAALLVGCSAGEASVAPTAPRPVVVRTAPVSTSGELPATTYAGVVRSADEATLSFAVGGRIDAILVEPGQEVRAGTVLARLDGARYRHALDAASAQLAELQERLEQAERESSRATRLADIDAASLEEVERRASAVMSLRSNAQAIRAQRDQAAWQLGEAVLEAPFDGVVTTAPGDAGAVVSAGQPIVGLRSVQAVEVEVALAESDTSRVAVGDAVVVSFPLAGLPPVKGTTATVSRAAATGTDGFPLVVALPDTPGVVPGLTARVAVSPSGASADELTVPLAAIVSPFGDRTAVVVVRDGVSQSVDVTVGKTRGARVVIEGDLTANDQVVVAGHVGLVPGEPVEVR